MIHEEICTYEVAKLAKDKGFQQAFNYPHFKSKLDYYNHKGELNGDVGDILKLRLKHKPIPDDMQPISAPTQSLLQRWLREERGVCIAIYPNLRVSHFFEWIGYKKDAKCWTPVVSNMKEYNTYELALEDALKYALENLI